MGKLVEPKVYFIGETVINPMEFDTYLVDSGNEDFLESVDKARSLGLSDGEILVSFYAKLCYASLTLGKNENVTRVRDIPDNLKATCDAGHMSVWEHIQLNFVIRDCSRVFTHELVRHRVGTAFSQTSGRYVRCDPKKGFDLVYDPILEPVKEDIRELQETIADYYNDMVEKMGLNDPNSKLDFAKKKKITSALRRILPNGQSNEMGFSINLRALRHTVQMRTSRHAEWEIRFVFEQIYKLVKDKYPMLFYGAKEEIVNGLVEVSGMKMQPY